MVGLENFNNVLGPLRNTDVSPAVQSPSQPSNPSVTGHNGGSANATSKSKKAVKVQPSSKSFGGRQLVKAKPVSQSKPKH